MAEITNERLGELLRGVFQILIQNPEGLRAKDVLHKLEKLIPPSPFEATDYESTPGVRRYEKIVRFATVATVKAGWLVKTKGYWVITDAGIEVYNKITKPLEFRLESNRQYKIWEQSQIKEDFETSSEEVDDVDVEERDISYEKADEEAWAEIEKFISTMPPYDFQNKMIPGLLKGMGYHIHWFAPPGADGGVDVIAFNDPFGTNGPTIKISARRRQSKADVKDIREFTSLLNDNDVGIFFSISGFTKEAEREARGQRRSVRLFDLEMMFELWVDNYKNIPEFERGILPIKPVWFLSK